MRLDAIATAARGQLVLFVAATFAAIVSVVGVARANTDCTPNPDQPGMAMWLEIKKNCLDDPNPGAADCVTVDDHIVIARDSFKPSAFLVVARDPVCGIETPSIREPGAPNYWLAGWTHRGLVGDDWTVGLAINSEHRRSQNRLHIHLDRLCDSVAAALSTPEPLDSFSLPLLNPYRALTITIADLPHLNVFALVAAAEPSVPVADQSIALVASKADPAAAIVLYGSDEQGSGHAEDLFVNGRHCP